MKTLHVALLLAALALVGGCASPSASVGEAATTPLSDLNLVRAEIPPALAAAQKAPYAPPADRSCAALAADVQALDAVLGADLDAPPRNDDPGLVERGGNVAGDAAVGAIRRTAEDVVPFRGWVRKLTGAERYERRVQAAVTAGTIRRAYLKGIAQSLGCAPPAGPRTAAK